MKPLAFALLFAVALSTFSAPALAGEPDAMAQFDVDGFPPPSTKIKLIGIGTGLFALSYGAAIGSSYLFKDDTGAASLRIPIVGPWLKLGRTSLCDENELNCSNALKITGAVFAGIDGLLQAGSVALVLEGIFLQTKPSQERSRYLYRGNKPSTISRFLTYEGDQMQLVATPLTDQRIDLGFGFQGRF